MKIAFLITSMTYGGAERQLLSLSQGLIDNDFQVAVACLKKDTQLLPAFAEKHIPVHQIPLRAAVDPFVLPHLRGWLQQEAPDVLHTHLFKADVYGAFAARSNLPLVCTKHNIDQYLKNPAFGALGRAAAAKCRKVVTVSRAVQNFLSNEIHFPAEKMKVIHIAAPEPSGSGSDKSEQECLRIGIVARLAQQKGHDVLLRAFATARQKVQGLTLHIYGDGPLENYLRNMAAQLGLAASVRFEGIKLDPEEIYRNVDLVVLPSRWEGAGFVLLESMARGIPLIASDVGGIPEYATPDSCVFVAPNDVTALSDAITQVITDSNLRKRLSAGGMQRVKEFSAARMIQAHTELYREVAGS